MSVWLVSGGAAEQALPDPALVVLDVVVELDEEESVPVAVTVVVEVGIVYVVVEHWLVLVPEMV